MDLGLTIKQGNLGVKRAMVKGNYIMVYNLSRLLPGVSGPGEERSLHRAN